MNHLIFDSSALIAYLADEPGGAVVEEWLARLVGETEMQGLMCTAAVGELYHMTMRRKNEQAAERALRAISSLPLTIVAPEMELSIAAARLKATHAISYVDALSAALAIEHKGILLATDPVFDELLQVPYFQVQYL